MVWLSNLFNYSPEKNLAEKLAKNLAQNLPPKLMAQRRNVLSANKISRLLEIAFDNAKEHQKNNKMGFIKRAVLANSLRWELSNLGYPTDFINVAIEGLIIELSRPAAREKNNNSPEK